MKLNKKGETIVEVLLSIAVLGSVLGTTLAISARSRNTIQANQERYQAQLIANTQADSLKVYLATHESFIGECIVNGSARSGADCMMDNGANQDLYDVSIVRGSIPGAAAYKILVKWDSLIYGKTDQLELVYVP